MSLFSVKYLYQSAATPWRRWKMKINIKFEWIFKDHWWWWNLLPLQSSSESWLRFWTGVETVSYWYFSSYWRQSVAADFYKMFSLHSEILLSSYFAQSGSSCHRDSSTTKFKINLNFMKEVFSFHVTAHLLSLLTFTQTLWRYEYFSVSSFYKQNSLLLSSDFKQES